MTDTKTGVSAPQQRCGKPAMDFIPRQGLTFTCVLPLDHDGACRPGGHCFTHGDYVGEAGKPPTCPSCPQMGGWPSVAARASAPAEDRTTGEPETVPIAVHRQLAAAYHQLLDRTTAPDAPAEDRTPRETIARARKELWLAVATIAAMTIDGSTSDARIQRFAAQRLRIMSAVDTLTAENARLTAALDAARADTTDAERLSWLERNSARVHVVDPPSGDAWVWVVVATDDDNAPCEPEGQGDTLREAIDNAIAAARARPASEPPAGDER